MVAKLRIGFVSLLTNQGMNKEWTTQHEMRKLQVFHFFIGRPPTTHKFGVQSLPGGRGPGGKGDFLLEVFEGQNSQQETRRYPVNALNQYSNVILSRKYSYPEAFGTITKNYCTIKAYRARLKRDTKMGFTTCLEENYKTTKPTTEDLEELLPTLDVR